MKISRRHILGSGAALLGSKLLDVLTTPTWRWTGLPVLQAAPLPEAESASPVTYVDVAKEAGLNTVNVWGGVHHKSYIIEAKGSGLAFFDYDNDGWIDIYLTNGTRLGETWPPGKAPTT
ncbi:MAG TPA: CRTAC1 family protein, partial [Terriglobia bacterium]|nr:CRTAC1 family protein [Terriglobia bacterium]